MWTLDGPVNVNGSRRVDVDGLAVRFTSPEREYFPELGATKLDVANYYLAVGPGIVNALRERPGHDAPLPQGSRRRQGAPEARSQRCAAVAGDRARPFPTLRPRRVCSRR